MAAETEDKRVRRTKSAIREALLQLISDKPIARVTTTELCREANINRNTFYAHYSTPEDVLAELEDELLAELSSILDDDRGDGNVTLAMCRAIAASNERWRALWRGNASLIERALTLCRERTLVRWDMQKTRDLEMDEVFLSFITVGASGVVKKWLEDDCGMPPDQLGSLINKFVFEGMHAISE